MQGPHAKTPAIPQSMSITTAATMDMLIGDICPPRE